MADQDQKPPQEFVAWFDRANDPEMMYVAIPLLRCAENLEDGTALLRGKLEEAKAIALNHIKTKRIQKARNGIQIPGVTAPMAPLDVQVH